MIDLFWILLHGSQAAFRVPSNLSQLFVSAMVTSGLNTAAAPAALEGLSTFSRGSSGSGQRPNTVAVATWIPFVLVSRAENCTKNDCFIVINSQCA